MTNTTSKSFNLRDDWDWIVGPIGCLMIGYGIYTAWPPLFWILAGLGFLKIAEQHKGRPR